MLTADGDDIWSVSIAAWTERINIGWVVEFEVHCQVCMTQPPIRKGPNPWLLLALSLSSFAAFFTVVKRREQTHPASLQPRQADHPLVPPRHKE